jgi:DeoR family ulaG and ulaABCDEF operon transcriptional repressor
LIDKDLTGCKIGLVGEDKLHEIERQRIILGEIADRPVVTVAQLVELTGASEATIRRDINALHIDGKLRKVRGGAEALHPPQLVGIGGRHFSVSEQMNVPPEARHRARPRSISARMAIPSSSMAARRPIQMVDHPRPPADADPHQLVRHRRARWSAPRRTRSCCPAGPIYREQSLILSPFENDVTRNFYARRMFMSAQGVSPIGMMEGDPLLIQAEQKLINQADELILLVDSSKFERRSSLILCALDRVAMIITDNGIKSRDAKLIGEAGVRLLVVEPDQNEASDAMEST